MYVKVSDGAGQWAFVCEMTTPQLRFVAQEYPNRRHVVISGKEAHRWVREGGRHDTPLYVDPDNRIRYARDNT